MHVVRAWRWWAAALITAIAAAGAPDAPARPPAADHGRVVGNVEVLGEFDDEQWALVTWALERFRRR